MKIEWQHTAKTRALWVWGKYEIIEYERPQVFYKVIDITSEWNREFDFLEQAKDAAKLREILWDADFDCDHELDETIMSGIKCKKCPGWFCY
jgi:hypothetical protein